MSQAGPSQSQRAPRRKSSEHGNLHNEYPTTQAQKRRKVTDASEIFEQPKLEDQLRLNKDYRNLQVAADKTRVELDNVNVRDIAAALSKQSKLFENVQDTGIGTLDANLLKTNTENAMGLAKRFKIDGVSFDIDEFLLKLKGLLNLDRPELADQDINFDEEDAQPQGRRDVLGDWEAIGWTAAKYSRRITGAEFMFGPLTAQHKQRAANRSRGKHVIAAERRAAEVDNTQVTDKPKETDFVHLVKTVDTTLGNLDKGEGVNLFRLVVNPNDFGQTVENCFFLSFLINQGRAGIFVKDDGEVMAYKAREHDSHLEGEPMKNQAVLELDEETWMLAKETFDIRESAIPHRATPKII